MRPIAHRPIVGPPIPVHPVDVDEAKLEGPMALAEAAYALIGADCPALLQLPWDKQLAHIQMLRRLISGGRL